MKKLIIPLFIFLLIALFNSNAQAIEFNPNYIIADEDILNSTDMTLEQVRRFIQSKGGFLKDYIVDVDIINEPFRQMPAADFIYERAVQNGVNPKFILVLLQKEQSLITETNPSSRSLNFATGYGCPDNGTCSDRWLGFSKQVNSATLQFKDYIDNPQSYRYQVGQVYTFNDNRANVGQTTTIVTPLTKATAALYNYTPHVYNGNYNFWKLWHEWFSFSYPDGSVLQAINDPVVYLITNGQKRPFKSKAALLSRYPLNRIIQVDHYILDQFPLGETIKYPQYALYRSPQGTVYMIIDDIKHGFTSREVMKIIGVNPEEIENLSQSSLDEIPEGKPITIDSSYPMGTLLQSKESGTIYYVKDGQKFPIVNNDILTVNFGNKPLLTTVTSDELRKYIAMPPLYLSDGVLVTSDDPLKRAVYVISNGIKRPIVSGEAFTSLGYKWENIYSVSDGVIQMHPTGEAIDIIN